MLFDSTARALSAHFTFSLESGTLRELSQAAHGFGRTMFAALVSARDSSQNAPNALLFFSLLHLMQATAPGEGTQFAGSPVSLLPDMYPAISLEKGLIDGIEGVFHVVPYKTENLQTGKDWWKVSIPDSFTWKQMLNGEIVEYRLRFVNGQLFINQG